jgi:hypothetical protein
MRAKRRDFTALTPDFQQKLLSVLTEKYVLKGDEAPVKKALAKIGELRPQTRKSWQRQVFFTMQQIDKLLVGKGLPPKHFK